MNWRNFKILIVGGGICLVLLIASIVLSVIFGGKHSQVAKELESSLTSLKKLKSSATYPSQNNLQVIKRNIDALEGFKKTYQDELGSAQIEPIDGMSRTQFMAYFEEVRRDLRKSAERVDENSGKKKVKLPAQFGAGFETYLTGIGPNQTVVPRLTIQLQSVEAVCRLLFDLGVDALVDVNRNEFEAKIKEKVDESDSRGRNKRSRATPVEMKDPNSHLYSRDCFTFKFNADESTTWNVIDALSSDATPMLIHDISIENLNKSLQPKLKSVKAKSTARRGRSRSSAKKAKPKKGAKALLMEEAKVVAGEELLQTTMRLCVYRYVQDENDAEASE